ncbi:MAG TPA: RNA polymerase sigma factor, partial [Ktedonobacteraceae bacterium]
IGNREQAYDLAQDVFVKAYKALLGGTNVQPGALSAWLYRIAANTTTDTLRRRRLISWLPLSLFNEDRGIGAGVLSESGGVASEGFTTGNEEGNERHGGASNALYERGGYDGGRFENRVADREIVERVMSQLQPKYAVCLWLYEHDGLSCAEIAQVLNISPSAVKMRLMRARERFIALHKQEVTEE